MPINYKNADFYRVQGDLVKSRLYSGGVPSRYWGATGDFELKAIATPHDPPIRATIAQQLQLLTDLRGPKHWQQSRLFVICSKPTSYAAEVTAFAICSEAVKEEHGLTIEAINCAQVPQKISEEASIIVLWNIAEHITTERTMAIRDLATRYKERMVMLVAGGLDPGMLATDYLALKADGYLFLNDKKRAGAQRG